MPVSLLAAAGIHFVKKNPTQKLNVIKNIYKTRVTTHLTLFTFTKGATTLSTLPILI